MRKIYSSIFFLSFVTLSFAQNSGSIRGSIVDTVLKQSIADVTITILQAKDSSLVTFGRSNKSGVFNIRYLPRGSYRLLATHVGYRNYSWNFEITDDKKEIDAGYMILNSKTSVLEEVTVSQEKPPVVFKNDTIEFNAGSFKTKPNSVVEDLLKKLPGVQVDKDGKIKANGEEVKKILVDGKEFFGNDPKVASKNLPADVVDKVQVFDKKSDQSQFTGFEDGNNEKTINLTLKADKKNGVFGRADAGIGNKDRYQGKFNLNSFKGERQVSALGMANNTNKQGFSFIDMFNFTGGFGGTGGKGGGMVEMDNAGLPIQGLDNSNNTITTTWAGGLNFNDNWSKNLTVNGSYFYSRIQDAIDQKTNRKYLLADNSFTRLQDAIVYKKNENHRINFSADYTIDSLNSVKLTTTANIQNSFSNSNSIYNSISDKGHILNNGYSSNQSKSTGYTWNNSMLWRHKFSKKGRTLSANFSLGLNNAENDGTLRSQNSFFNPDGSDTLDQLSDQENEGLNYGVSLSYTEPLSKRSLLEVTYNFNKNTSQSAKETFDIDHVTGKYNLRNDLLSNDFENQYAYNRAGLNWRFQQKKFNFSAGSSVQQASLESQFHMQGSDSMINRSFSNLLPNARLQYKFNKFKNLRLNYNTFTRQPNATQLNPIPDNTDPLNIRIGNADLEQEYNHRLQVNYMAFDPFRKTSFFSMINFVAKQNSIVNDDQISAQGIRISKPANVDGAYNLTGTLSWGLPVKIIKSNLNINTDFSQERTSNFINGLRNNVLTRNITEQLNLNFIHKEVLDITVGTNISYNTVRYSLESKSIRGIYRVNGKDSAVMYKQNFINFFPTANFNYIFNRNKNFRFNYRGRTNQPSVSQLQDVRDETNALRTVQGNPGLKQEFSNNINASYNSFSPVTFKYINVNVNYNQTSNRIVNSIDFDTARGRGVQLIRPVNLNGSFNTSSSITLGIPLRKNLKGSSINFSNNINYNRDVSLLYNQKNTTNSISIRQRVGLNMDIKEKLNFEIRASVSYNNVIYRGSQNKGTSTSVSQQNTDNEYFTQTYSTEFNYFITKSLIVSTDFDYLLNTGRAEGFNQNIPLWNGSLAHQLFKKKNGEIKLSVNDILNQNQSISRNIGDNYIEDTRTVVLKRYFMLSFTYNLNRAGNPAQRRGGSQGPQEMRQRQRPDNNSFN